MHHDELASIVSPAAQIGRFEKWARTAFQLFNRCSYPSCKFERPLWLAAQL